MLTVAHNLTAYNTQRQFGLVNSKRAKSAEKLSSGYRINRSADDAAGLAISEKMRRQIRGFNQGAANIQDGISLCQVADGALSDVHDMLHRMTELSVKSANGTLSPQDRQYIQEEVNHLSAEINRIGRTTRFNDQLLFDSENKEITTGTITQLVTCASADSGYMSESYRVNNSYMPAAYLDFSNVNESNVAKLHGGNFGFYCSRGCNEVFDVTFVSDGTPSSAKNLGDANHQEEHHYYTIDISGCKNGSDVVDSILNYVGTHLPYQRPESTSTYGDLRVSHSNHLSKVGESELVIYANRRVVNFGNYSATGYSTAEQAANAYPIPNYPKGDIAGKVFCSTMTETIEEEPIFKFEIQCSSQASDVEYVETHRMNAEVLGVDPLDVSTQNAAAGAIKKVKNAVGAITKQRSEIGAQQNRLEHSFNMNLNAAENTQYAESVIRDTDMAKEMVHYSINNVLSQAGQSMMTQANQSNQGVMVLLR